VAGDAGRAEGRLSGPFSDRLDFRVLGTEVDELFDSMLPGFGRLLPRWRSSLARRLGWSLWTDGRRG
jgi:hypothetical protein